MWLEQLAYQPTHVLGDNDSHFDRKPMGEANTAPHSTDILTSSPGHEVAVVLHQQATLPTDASAQVPWRQEAHGWLGKCPGPQGWLMITGSTDWLDTNGYKNHFNL